MNGSMQPFLECFVFHYGATSTMALCRWVLDER